MGLTRCGEKRGPGWSKSLSRWEGGRNLLAIARREKASVVFGGDHGVPETTSKAEEVWRGQGSSKGKGLTEKKIKAVESTLEDQWKTVGGNYKGGLQTEARRKALGQEGGGGTWNRKEGERELMTGNGSSIWG